jgi:acetyltransferase (GNAT) family protein
MFFHKRGGFDSRAYESNRKAKRALTEEAKAHGTIVYCGGDPVAWCQYGPREELPRIDGKRGYRPTTADPWRVTCLFVAPGHRKSGLAGLAVKESIRAMKKLRVKTVESYPVEGRTSASLLWMGTPHLFESLGFVRVGPLGKGNWIYSLNMGRP